MARGRRSAVLAGLVLGLLAVHLAVPGRAQPGAPPPVPPAAGAAGPGAPGDPARVGQLLLGLVAVLVAAKLGAELFERRGQPGVLGEILAGILLGNLTLVGFNGLTFMPGDPGLLALSELGVIVLLFEVGLESNVAQLRRVGLSSLLVATLGVAAPMVLGWGVGRLFLPHESPLTHLFLGATLSATSVGITARVLRDLGQLQRPEARIILGAAVIDDVLGLVVLALVSGVISAANTGGALRPFDILWIMAKAAGFLLGAWFLGSRLSSRLFGLASKLQTTHMLLVTSLAACFLLAYLAAQLDLAPIVGAFAAGLILDPVHYRDFTDRGEHSIEELIRPLSGFLVPFFFVMTGMKVDLRALFDLSNLGFALALTAAAILGKQVCALGVRERGLNRRAVGIGMIPRGEVGLIFASVGLGLQLVGPQGHPEPVVTPGSFSSVVFMVLATTLIAPPLLKWSLLSPRPGGRRKPGPRPGGTAAAGGQSPGEQGP